MGARLGDIEKTSNEAGFAIYAPDGEPIVGLIFDDERAARRAHKLSQELLASLRAILTPERQGPKPSRALHWLVFTWPSGDTWRPRDVETTSEDWDFGLVNFGLQDVRDYYFKTPPMMLKAAYLEDAIQEAAQIWDGSKDWRPHGEPPSGYQIVTPHGIVEFAFEADPNDEKFFAVPKIGKTDA